MGQGRTQSGAPVTQLTWKKEIHVIFTWVSLAQGRKVQKIGRYRNILAHVILWRCSGCSAFHSSVLGIHECWWNILPSQEKLNKRFKNLKKKVEILSFHLKWQKNWDWPNFCVEKHCPVYKIASPGRSSPGTSQHPELRLPTAGAQLNLCVPLRPNYHRLSSGHHDLYLPRWDKPCPSAGAGSGQLPFLLPACVLPDEVSSPQLHRSFQQHPATASTQT